MIPKMTNSQVQQLVIQLIWKLAGEESSVKTALNDRKNESLKLTIKCIIISIFYQTLAIIVNRCVIGIVWISSLKDSACIPSEDITCIYYMYMYL